MMMARSNLPNEPSAPIWASLGMLSQNLVLAMAQKQPSQVHAGHPWLNPQRRISDFEGATPSSSGRFPLESKLKGLPAALPLSAA